MLAAAEISVPRNLVGANRGHRAVLRDTGRNLHSRDSLSLFRQFFAVLLKTHFQEGSLVEIEREQYTERTMRRSYTSCEPAIRVVAKVQNMSVSLASPSKAYQG